jgi:hypothetical protein
LEVFYDLLAPNIESKYGDDALLKWKMMMKKFAKKWGTIEIK